jgi:hypothetical protein
MGKKDILEGKPKLCRFKGFFFNFIFNSNKGILVTLHFKTTSFWVFHPF